MKLNNSHTPTFSLIEKIGVKLFNMAGRKNRNGKKIQATLDSVELEKYEALGSDTLAIRYAFRKTFGLCLHPVVLVEDDGMYRCYICQEKNPQRFSKFTHKPTDENQEFAV